ncbi:MAG: cytochrome c biogenesis protein CcsA [Deltaproteobacteria bacterium]|nr:cytochrome c biogenesis protein CcsA [Deltaproteobacteria bacterium]MBW2393428.1 cytochrome c biogenesis protein CcsA [Deltaproteobacteria bacterium]
MMGLLFHQLATVAYLLAALLAVLRVILRKDSLGRAAVFALGAGVLLHTGGFWKLHTFDPMPSMNSLPMALSFMAWVGALVYLGLLFWVRGQGLILVVAPAAFLGCVSGLLSLYAPQPTETLHPVWSHLHVLLSSAGLATLGVAAGAGLLYIGHHRAIKRKRRVVRTLPPLESLDRVNTVGLGVGFLLLTFGLFTGMLWVYATEGRFWEASLHANATLGAWVLCGAATLARFGFNVGARPVAFLSAAGFALLVFAVVGAGAFS